MNKKYACLILCVLLLTACSPYGITGNPDPQDSSDTESTPEEIAAMENPKTFSITVEEFEKAIVNNDNQRLLIKTESGFNTKDKTIHLTYGSTEEKNYLLDLYLFVDESKEDFQDIEDKFTAVLEIIFHSLEVSYDISELKANLKGNDSLGMDTDDVLIEITNNSTNIQLVIIPK
ncbi:hypothetical protein GW626_15480 [Peribacillus muralis]|uniref:hypothetical protein n=1 Tax=Peribacillus muralis TaxID=264697 RepID=UPI001F4EAAAE|nr:hypothetical protein [Peribacillus muralis]MCK1991751.1 hypothetical protein [Peribacillus muralis]MCK2012309.1 hypothetical protein [Peribacillus muralis]